MGDELSRCTIAELFRICVDVESERTDTKPFAHVDDLARIELEKQYVDSARKVLSGLRDKGIAAVRFGECDNKPNLMTIGGAWLFQLAERPDTWQAE